MATPPSLLDRARAWLYAPADVCLVCEVAADYVLAARYRGPRIEAWAAAPLPDDAVHPAPLAENLLDFSAVQRALEGVVGAVSKGDRQAVLLVPDLVGRIALLELEQLPTRPQEVDALLRWRLKKDFTFDVQQAVLSYHVQPGKTAAHEVLVAVSLPHVLRQYEACLEGVGLRPGWVSLSTLATVGCLETDGTAARLLAKRDNSSLSLAILHGQAIRLFRTMPLIAAGAGVSAEGWFDRIYPGLVFFQDHWGRNVDEVLLVGFGDVEPALQRRLADQAGCPVRRLALPAPDLPRPAAGSSVPVHFALPALGWACGETL